MTMRSTTSLLAALALAAGSGLAMAQQGEPASLVNRDDDGDGAVSKSEYMAREDGAMFDAFDTDESGTVSEREFEAGMFGIADTDDSGSLDPEEMEAFDTVRGVGEEID